VLEGIVEDFIVGLGGEDYSGRGPSKNTQEKIFKGFGRGFRWRNTEIHTETGETGEGQRRKRTSGDGRAHKVKFTIGLVWVGDCGKTILIKRGV